MYLNSKIKYLAILLIVAIGVIIAFFNRRIKTGIVIRRKIDDGVQTAGKFDVYVGGIKVLSGFTIELPYKNNSHYISSIPKGIYDAEVLQSSGRFNYPHIWIKNVPNRTGIKIHAGNFYTQLLGCVLVGTRLKDINNDGYYDVQNSMNTLQQIIRLLPKNFKVKII